MDPPKTWGEPMCSPRVNQFFFLIRHPLSYSYVNASVVKVWSMIEERKDLPDGEKIYLMEKRSTWWRKHLPDGEKIYLMEKRSTWWRKHLPDGEKIYLMEKTFTWWRKHLPDGEKKTSTWWRKDPLSFQKWIIRNIWWRP